MPMVKRVVGIGGDTVKCCGTDGRLTVNGTPVEEPYLHGKTPASGTPFEAKVPQGQVFLLGDDRSSRSTPASTWTTPPTARSR